MSSKEANDGIVLNALRKIAANGAKRRIGNKNVQLAEPKGGDCVYMRVALWLEQEGIEVKLDSYDDVVRQYKALRDVMKRLTDANLLYPNGQTTDNSSFWVVMDD